MAEGDPPSVAERQHVERLAGAVMSGMAPSAALGHNVSFRVGYVLSIVLREEPKDPERQATPRYQALLALYQAAVRQKTGDANPPSGGHN